MPHTLTGAERLTQANRAASRSLRYTADPGGPAYLRELADFADGLGERTRGWDHYGEDGPVSAVEKAVVQLLGKPAAAWFPSGVMAQQCALRIHTDRADTRRVALPELSHLLVHEEDGPRILQDLDIVVHTRGEVVCRAQDIAELDGPLAAVLLELPLRDGGYLLPTWKELVGVSQECRARGVPLHLDGARLWESWPHFDHTLPQIAELFDTVYVSFYKGLAGLSGAVLAGPEDLIDEAKVWRRRMGGTVYRTWPEALAALRGIQVHLPVIPVWVARAKALAAALAARGVEVTPNPPHTNAFRIFARGTVDEVSERAAVVTERTDIAVTSGWVESSRPGWCFTEFTVGTTTMDWDVAEAAELIVEAVVSRA